MVALNNVLLVEDNPGDARLVKEHLKERFGADCVVHQALTLGSALEMLQDGDMDIVLLDLGLPDSSGLEAVVAIQKAAPRTPVVILTGDDDEGKALEALKQGAEDYLAKQQVDSVTLVRTMRHAVQRKRQREQLRDSESLYKTLVESAEEGVLQFSPEGKLKYVNRRGAELLGFPADDDLTRERRLGRRLHSWVAPAHHARANLLLRMASAERYSCELQLMREDGEHCVALAASSAVEARGAEAQDVVVLITDITGRKLAESEVARMKGDLEARVTARTAELTRANDELQAVNRALAHDLRNPLNGIIGLARLVRTDTTAGLQEKTTTRLQMLEKAALDMNQLISGLLALGSLGRQSLTPEAIDLSELVEQMAQRLVDSDPARDVSFAVESDVRVTGDRALLTNVLQNLLDNAWKYTAKVPHPRIEFRTRLNELGKTVYEVIDNGVGFPPEEAAALFQPYQRLSTAQGFEGHGLGLAGVKRIIERHGGRIWATSVPGVRTVFQFTLADELPQ